jgi:ATP-dependent RNA helicase DDX60
VAKEEYLLLMCHLFGRRYLPRGYSETKVFEYIRSRYPSRIVLPPLPHAARQALLREEGKMLQIYTTYAFAFAQANEKSLVPEHCLPLSKVEIGTRASIPGSAIQTHLRSTSLTSTIRSPFVSNSGHSDTFESITELTRTAKAGLNLNGTAVPSFSPLLRAESDHRRLNAYLYDFYKHGQVTALVAANGIRRGDIWYLLQDFTLTLAVVKSALEFLMAEHHRLTTEAAKTSTKDASSSEPDEESEDFSITLNEPSMDDGTMGVDEDEDAITSDVKESMVERKASVLDEDWNVYVVASEAWHEFNTKFKAMWA